MTPDELASIHADAFSIPPPWSALDFTGFLADPACFLCAAEKGAQVQAFALFRVAADEAELLTVATQTDARRQGLGRAVVQAGLAEAQRRGATRCYLEVAANNAEARALYRAVGFSEQGRRPGYYRVPSCPPVDALVYCALLHDPSASIPDHTRHRIILY